MELVDTSVWAQKANPRVKPWFDTALVRGELAICDQIALEILAGTTSPALYRETRDDLRSVACLLMDANDWRRAIEVYDLLEERGTNTRRSVKIADLLIAALRGALSPVDRALRPRLRDYRQRHRSAGPLGRGARIPSANTVVKGKRTIRNPISELPAVEPPDAPLGRSRSRAFP